MQQKLKGKAMANEKLTTSQAQTFATIANNDPTSFASIKSVLTVEQIKQVEIARGVLQNKQILRGLEFNKRLVAKENRNEDYANSLKKLCDTLPEFVKLVQAVIVEQESGTPGTTERRRVRVFTLPVAGTSIHVKVGGSLSAYKQPRVS